MSCAWAYARAWGLDMEHGACVYTRTVPHLHHLPSTPEYGNKICSCLCKQPPRIRIRMHNSLIHLSTHPPAASNLKAAPQRVGALAVAGWQPWLVRRSPDWRTSYQALPSLSLSVSCQFARARFASASASAFAARICFFAFRAHAARLHVAAARVVRCAVCSRGVLRGGLRASSRPHTQTHFGPLVVCTVTGAGR
jgi:hypothetical protein